MAAVQPVLKKTRMPPKRPAFPRNPVVFNPKARAKPPLRTSAVCRGGPWHSRRVMLLANEPTIVFSISAMRGRYVPTGEIVPVPGVHHRLMVSEYVWEAV